MRKLNIVVPIIGTNKFGVKLCKSFGKYENKCDKPNARYPPMNPTKIPSIILPCTLIKKMDEINETTNPCFPAILSPIKALVIGIAILIASDAI